MGLQFRAEIFNLFNHPQFFMNGISATGEQDIGTPSSFGVLNGTVNNPRLVQLALSEVLGVSCVVVGIRAD